MSVHPQEDKAGHKLNLPVGKANNFVDDNALGSLCKYQLSWFQYLAGMMPRAIMQFLQRLQKERTRQLEGLAEPVSKEVFKRDLDIEEGSVPEGLEGLYIRTGPNVQHQPTGGYHTFDGDAMVHAVYFSGGKACTYHNHWLRTPRLLYELAFGGNLWPRLGDLKGMLGVVIILFSKAFGALMLPSTDDLTTQQLGNTALTFHNGRLLALNEGSFPFLLRACKGFVESIGAFVFGGKLTHAFTAHPKIDPDSGELHSFCYKLDGKKTEWCLYQVTSPSGVLSQDYPVDISRPQTMHDFAITENYVVFMDIALIFDTNAMVKDGGLPFRNDTETPCRIGLLKRADPAAPIQWFQVAPFVCFHTVNAWEEAGTSLVHLVCCKSEKVDLGASATGEYTDGINSPNIVRFSLDLCTGSSIESKVVSGKPCEFPVVPPQHVGRSTPFAYTSAWKVGQADLSDIIGINKVDIHASNGLGIVADIIMPEGHNAGEPCFVPRPDATHADDGWLIVFSTNKKAGVSYCKVFDAKTMNAKPLCSVVLPQRVPTGFHGMFVSQAQLNSQVKGLNL